MLAWLAFPMPSGRAWRPAWLPPWNRRRRRAGWLLFWAAAVALAPAGRCLAYLGGAAGRR